VSILCVKHTIYHIRDLSNVKNNIVISQEYEHFCCYKIWTNTSIL